jgi:hypothetical protein
MGGVKATHGAWVGRAGQDNLFFVQRFDPSVGAMVFSKEVLFFAAATVVVFDLETNIQRFFHHSDNVTAVTLLRRVYQKPDASWTEMERPIGAKAAEEWHKWELFNKGVYQPGPKDWAPESLLLPQTSDDYPQVPLSSLVRRLPPGPPPLPT